MGVENYGLWRVNPEGLNPRFSILAVLTSDDLNGRKTRICPEDGCAWGRGSR